ncbi:hypothetical protein AB0M39_05170 [Streptomyces sp. NPDC051907]|uniref:hypothetical protein n=1 Tax=Streptomyces sp. NPDC051907 TaxID=3155284 RepID=UPI003447574E
MSRSTLPPPPPPAEIRAWPDDESMLNDRGRAMGELSRLSIGLSRLLLFWLTAAGFAAGWGMIGAALTTFHDGVDATSYMLIPIFMAIGLGAMIPTGLVIVAGIRRDKAVRERLAQWSSLAHDPARDARHRAPGESLLWLIPSFVLCALGLWVCFAYPAGARPGSETYAEVTVVMGMGFIMWLTGLLGVAKAVTHYRWAVRLGRG